MAKQTFTMKRGACSKRLLIHLWYKHHTTYAHLNSWWFALDFFKNSSIPIFNFVGLFIAEQFLKEDYRQTKHIMILTLVQLDANWAAASAAPSEFCYFLNRPCKSCYTAFRMHIVHWINCEQKWTKSTHNWKKLLQKPYWRTKLTIHI